MNISNQRFPLLEGAVYLLFIAGALFSSGCVSDQGFSATKNDHYIPGAPSVGDPNSLNSKILSVNAVFVADYPVIVYANEESFPAGTVIHRWDHWLNEDEQCEIIPKERADVYEIDCNGRSGKLTIFMTFINEVGLSETVYASLNIEAAQENITESTVFPNGRQVP